MIAIITSDNHLGVYYARLRPERLEQRRQALQRGFERVVDAAIERKVDLFLHAGDLFDRPDPRNAERVFVARQVKRLVDAGIPIFAIAGNHDRPRSFGYDGGTMPHEELQALGAIRLFRNTDELAPETVVIDGHRICVWGMTSDFNLPDEVCPLAESAARHRKGGDIDLVLLHYGVDGWAPPQSQEPLLSRASLEQLQADAICVGHLHARQETRLASGAVLLNPGSTEHIHFGEEHLDCGCWLLHLAPGHVSTEYVPLPTQPMLTIELDLSLDPPNSEQIHHKDSEDTGEVGNHTQEVANRTGLENVREQRTTDNGPLTPEGTDPSPLMAHALDRITSTAHPDQLFRLRLKGSISHSRFRALDIPRLQAHGAALNFHCQVDTDRLLVCEHEREIPIGYGVSFDVTRELEETVNALAASFGDDPAEQEICRLAGERIRSSVER